MRRKNRWYDPNLPLAHMVDMFITLPKPTQVALANFIIRTCEETLQEEADKRGLKTLGAEKIVKLNKSMQRKRGIDANKMLYRAINYLTILSDDSQTKVTDEVVALTQLITNYLNFCKTCALTPASKEMEMIIRHMQQGGLQNAETYLNKLQAPWAKKQSATLALQKFETKVDDTLMTVIPKK